MAKLPIQTLAQRQAVIRARLLQSNPGQFSTSPGSFVGNLMIAPLAVSDVQQQSMTYLVAVGEAIQDILALEQDAQTLQLIAQAQNTTVASIMNHLTALLNSWGSNFLTPRLGVEYATGVALLGTPSAPTTDIVVTAGKTVATSGGVQYAVQTPATMFAATAGVYWDPIQLMFILPVNVKAVSPGADGNQPSGSLTTITTAISGLSFVTNSAPLSGGRNVETDLEYGTRLLQIWQAYGRLTGKGLSYYPETLVPGVLAVYVASTGDPLSVRGSGRTDLWVQGEQISAQTDIFGAPNHPTIPNAVIPTKRPIVPGTLVQPAGATAVLVQDTTSAVAGSVASLDYILFTSPFPAGGATLQYDYNAVVGSVQALYNNQQYAPAAQQQVNSTAAAVQTPILAKQAVAIDIDYTVTIMILPGYVPSQVQTAVIAALEAFMATWRLATTVYVDDLNKIVEATPGVLRIAGTPSTFNYSGQSGVLQAPITTGVNQYPQLLNISIL